MDTLQSRYKLEKNFIYYYGLRNRDHLFENKIKVNKKQLAILKILPKDLTEEEKKILGPKIYGVAVVNEKDLKKVPTSFKEARFCTKCAANDFMIPGLEFDEEGKCPICQCEEDTKDFKAVVPVLNSFPKSKKSRFDVAVFYTGGKDSTYLLYYLSKVKGYRVLALTWEIPYMSLSAKKSIEGAKKMLPKVEFMTRKMDDDDLRKIYNKLYSLAENTCACPSLAYVLFYPELVNLRVPYFVAGNEPAQMVGLYFNHMAPKMAYKFGQNKFLNFLVNVGRILTLHPPLKKGQIQTLMTMKQLAYGDNPFKNLAGYRNDLVSNVVTAIHEVPSILKPLKRAIRYSSWTRHIPAFVQVDLDDISGGHYDWRKVMKLMIDECGYCPPESIDKGLHTSCQIEKCKEYSQFIRFYEMRSTMIPFSALEISIASAHKNLTREQAIKECEQELGFSLKEVKECMFMKAYLKE